MRLRKLQGDDATTLAADAAQLKQGTGELHETALSGIFAPT